MQAFFIEGSQGTGERLCVYHAPPSGTVKSAVVYLHPFAEEMNKSRRMAAIQSRALAQAGHAVLQIDLLGCGDSSGDFGDATWAAWIDDAVLAARWLRTRHPDTPLWLWGLRAGCLLAVEAAAHIDAPCNFLFWQPSPSGKQLVQQFLRLKMAAELQGGKSAGVTEALRHALAGGQTVEVAGYRLGAALARGLEQATLRPPAHVERAVWLETSTRADATMLPATQMALTAWLQAGHAVQASVVAGPAFWQTQEIEDAPALITSSLQAFEGHRCAVTA